MSKRVILITGTPCVGKTQTAQKLAKKLNALNINLTELATKENLILGKDKKRRTTIVDEKAIKKRISEIIKKTQGDIIIDGHYAVNVVPKKLISYVFVLRRNPIELKKLMEQRDYAGPKLWENLASEILDVCLVDALNALSEGRICELDVSGKSPEETVKQIVATLDDEEKCYTGIIDWIGKLESEGLLDEYLKI